MVQPIVLSEQEGEFGFITDVMSEAAYKEKAEQYGEVINRIRVR